MLEAAPRIELVEGFAGTKVRSWTSTGVHEVAAQVHSRSPTCTCVREGPAPSSRQPITSDWERDSDLVLRGTVWVASAGPSSIVVRLPVRGDDFGTDSDHRMCVASRRAFAL
jgi:hypothetical protein